MMSSDNYFPQALFLYKPYVLNRYSTHKLEGLSREPSTVIEGVIMNIPFLGANEPNEQKLCCLIFVVSFK